MIMVMPFPNTDERVTTPRLSCPKISRLSSSCLSSHQPLTANMCYIMTGSNRCVGIIVSFHTLFTSGKRMMLSGCCCRAFSLHDSERLTPPLPRIVNFTSLVRQCHRGLCPPRYDKTFIVQLLFPTVYVCKMLVCFLAA